MNRQSRFTLSMIVVMITVLFTGAVNVLADDAPTTSEIAGTWFGNMHYSNRNAVERVKLTIPAGCEEGDVCGTMLNYPTQCVWEITYDGYSSGAYQYHFSNTLKGPCPSGSFGSLTSMPDGSLYRMHTTPFFDATGSLNKLPHQ